MLVVKVIEISVLFSKSIEDVVQQGFIKMFELVKYIKGGWFNEIKVVIDFKGKIIEWCVNMCVSFVVE